MCGGKTGETMSGGWRMRPVCGAHVAIAASARSSKKKQQRQTLGRWMGWEEGERDSAGLVMHGRIVTAINRP